MAEDTPQQLTARLTGADRLSLQVRGPADEIFSALQSLDGVRRVLDVRTQPRRASQSHRMAVASSVTR